MLAQRQAKGFKVRKIMTVLGVLTVLAAACSLLPLPLPPVAEATIAPTTNLPPTSTAAQATEAPPTATAEATEAPPTATVQPTVVIDFEIPAAPSGIDEALWKEAYVSLMTTRPTLRKWLESGQMRVFWHTQLDTVAWSVGSDVYAYNREFGFMGDVVKDAFGRLWIVRRKLTHRQGYCSSIWNFNKLHLPDDSELVMGAQAIVDESGDDSVAIVGQVVGQEVIDLSPFLIPGFDSLSEYDTGIFYGRENLVFKFFNVRVPTRNGYEELRVPVCPENYCDDKYQISTLSSPGCGKITTGELLDRVETGSMVYFHTGTIRSLPEGTTISTFRELREDPEQKASMSVACAFGTGEHLRLILSKYLAIELSGGYLLDCVDGTPTLFDLNQLTAERITPPVSGVLFSTR